MFKARLEQAVLTRRSLFSYGDVLRHVPSGLGTGGWPRSVAPIFINARFFLWLTARARVPPAPPRRMEGTREGSAKAVSAVCQTIYVSNGHTARAVGLSAGTLAA